MKKKLMKILYNTFFSSLMFGSILSTTNALAIDSKDILGTRDLKNFKERSKKIAQENTKVSTKSFPGYISATERNNNTIIISAGHTLGLRYTIAGALCNTLNTSDTSCTVYPTMHSGESIDALQEGKTDFAIAQSDWLAHAKDATSRFKGYGKGKNLRAIARFNSESVFLIANKNSGIQDAIDLNNVRMNIGEDKSYTRIATNAVLKSVGFSINSLKIFSEQNNDTAARKLCENKIDAAIFVLPSYSPLIADIMKECSVKIISFTKKQIRYMEKSLKGFTTSTVDAKTYWRQKNNVETIALSSVLVTLQSTPVHIVDKWRNAIVNNVNIIRKLHPMLRNITKESMTRKTSIKYYDK